MGILRVVQRLSEFLHGGPKKKKKISSEGLRSRVQRPGEEALSGSHWC